MKTKIMLIKYNVFKSIPKFNTMIHMGMFLILIKVAK